VNGFIDRELLGKYRDLRKGRITEKEYEDFLIITGRYKIYEGKI